MVKSEVAMAGRDRGAVTGTGAMAAVDKGDERKACILVVCTILMPAKSTHNYNYIHLHYSCVTQDFTK